MSRGFWYATFIKSLIDQIEEENPSLLAVLSPLGHERFDCESTVCASSPIPEATLCLVI